MERHLIVMRHAKSSWKQPGLSDHERPLNGRGRRDAPRVARVIAEAGWTPELVVSSDARRTSETLERMLPSWQSKPTIDRTRALYLAGWAEVYGVADLWPEDVERVLVLGHNPGWEALCARLTGQWREMTTANAALLRGEGQTWRAALEGTWALVDWIRPRELP